MGRAWGARGGIPSCRGSVPASAHVGAAFQDSCLGAGWSGSAGRDFAVDVQHHPGSRVPGERGCPLDAPRAEVGTLATPQAMLKAAGWPRADKTVVIVGHQPVLGQAAALALTGSVADWSMKKGAVWWLVHRDSEDKPALRTVIGPDLV